MRGVMMVNTSVMMLDTSERMVMNVQRNPGGYTIVYAPVFNIRVPAMPHAALNGKAVDASCEEGVGQLLVVDEPNSVLPLGQRLVELDGGGLCGCSMPWMQRTLAGEAACAVTAVRVLPRTLNTADAPPQRSCSCCKAFWTTSTSSSLVRFSGNVNVIRGKQTRFEVRLTRCRGYGLHQGTAADVIYTAAI